MTLSKPHSSSPLVWATAGNRHKQAAHLLASKGDQCQIRWLSTNATAWVPQDKVSHELAPRRRRCPGKIESFDVDMNIIVDDPTPQQEPLSNITESRDDDKTKSSSPVPVSEREEPQDGETEDTPTSSRNGELSVCVLLDNMQDNRKVTQDETNDEDQVSAANTSSVMNQCYKEGECSQPHTKSIDKDLVLLENDSIENCSSQTFPQTSLKQNEAATPSAVQTMSDCSFCFRNAICNRLRSILSWSRRKITPFPTTIRMPEKSKPCGNKRPRDNDAGWNLKPLVPPPKKRRTNTIAVRNVQNDGILMEEVIRRIATERYDVVREGIERRIKSGKSINTTIVLQDADGSQRITSPMLAWASDRYHHVPEDPNAFLTEVDLKKDAHESLKLLLDNGANPYVAAAKDSGQTPLHAAAAGGFVFALAALLEQVSYTVDQLKILDHNGDTPLHTALRNGNYDCFNLFMEKYSAEIYLEQILDARGDNVLAFLVLFTDIPYGQDIHTYSSAQSKILTLLKRILYDAKEEQRVKPLIHQNKAVETAMAVAAKCGHYHELQELSKLEFDCGRSVSNRCVCVDGKFLSPLDLALETMAMIERRASRNEFIERGIIGIDAYLDDTIRFANWMERGVIPSISLLEKLQEPLELRSLRQLSRHRRGVSEISPEQVLTEKAKELQSKYALPGKNPPTIRCDLHEWKCINGSRSQIRAQLLNMVRAPFTIPEVTSALIRDPKDACIRVSTSFSTKHYGVFANSFIPKHTVVCEYAGLVRREDEGEYDPNPEYGVKLTKCDEWARMEGGNYADAFILDAADIFNEASLINDVRDSVLGDGNEPELLRTENCAFVEVLVNKWPRVYVITLEDIQPGEELLLDYGASYWEKVSLTIMTERLQTAHEKNEELVADNTRLREQLQVVAMNSLH